MTRLEQLWEQFESERLTEPELREFLELIGEERSSSPIQGLLDDLLRSGACQGLADPRIEERIFQQLLERTRRRPRPVILFRRLAAAAAILILIMAGYFLFLRQHNIPSSQTQAQRFHNDIAPGSDKAILTLSNGKKIVLDGAANGLIAQEGSSNIQKPTPGLLTYKNESNKSFQSRESWSNTMSTPRGGQYQLVLADGTKVWLNAASSIRYPTAFTGKTRDVEISGEAYFEVARDASKPFTVSVNNIKVDVLGTNFNINAYPDEQDTRTTLLEGSVRIGATLLKPGDQAAVDNRGNIHITERADIDRALAWKNHLFIFSGDDIASVMRQLGRWYNINTVYEGNMEGRHFSGIVDRNNNISQVLKMLESTEKVKFRVEGTRVTVLE